MDRSHFNLPPLDWIRAFEAAARLGSFTAAAGETGLTQPAISQRIAHLERHLGARLFIRQPRAITLTVEGETWLPHVQDALFALSDSSAMLFANKRTRMTISASQSVIAMWLAPRLGAVSDTLGAEVSVQSQVLGTGTAPLDDTVQIRYGRGQWPHHNKTPLFAETLAPVCAPQLATDDWTKLPRIACTGPRPDWQQFAQRFGLSLPMVPHLRFDTLHGAISAAKAGCGVALGSLPLCAEDISSGELVQLSTGVLEHPETYWLIATREAISRRRWMTLSSMLIA